MNGGVNEKLLWPTCLDKVVRFLYVLPWSSYSTLRCVYTRKDRVHKEWTRHSPKNTAGCFWTFHLDLHHPWSVGWPYIETDRKRMRQPVKNSFHPFSFRHRYSFTSESYDINSLKILNPKLITVYSCLTDVHWRWQKKIKSKLSLYFINQRHYLNWFFTDWPVPENKYIK